MIRRLSIFVLGALTAMAAAGAEPPRADWGIDGVLTHFPKDDADFEGYVKLLRSSGVRWVRERGADENERVRGRMQAMQAAGLHVVAFAGTPGAPGPRSPGDQLSDDLLSVYQGAYKQGKSFAGLVDAWEMPGEPDIGYCRDLPERLVAFNKAMYLGIRDGAASAGASPVVLMGALGLSPGPWLERASANGLYDYTDAVNMHFYGRVEDLPGVIAAHRDYVRGRARLEHRQAAATTTLVAGERGWRSQAPGGKGTPRFNFRGSALPIWVTECGVREVAPDDFLNAQGRARQADFIGGAARLARREPDVAIFMPFILVHRSDGFAMTISSSQVLPAWTRYDEISEALRWPERPLALAPLEPSRLVMQWLPEPGSGRPHKVAGTYRFVDERPITGEVRIYNFSKVARSGRLEWSDGQAVTARVDAAGELVVPAMGSVVVPVVFEARRTGYFRETWQATFVPGDGGVATWPLSFGLERLPVASDFEFQPVALSKARCEAWRPTWPLGEKTTSEAGAWRSINGVELKSGSSTVAECAFRVAEPQRLPLSAPLISVRVAGLPDADFLRVTADRPMGDNRRVRLDLVDDRGQRFSIWENGGFEYFERSGELWLSLRDIHPFFWGRATSRFRFEPSRIVELQLRPYVADPAEVMTVRVEAAKAR